MTPHEKIEHLHKSGIVALIDEAVALAKNPGDDATRKFTKIVGKVAAKVQVYSACKTGCSHCCKQAVSVASWEAAKIGRYLHRSPAAVMVMTDVESNRKKYSGVACPFLKDHRCSIYEVRPFSCRSHFNMGDDPEACDIINRPGTTVPYFNSNPLLMTLVAITIEGGDIIADIREFFP